MEVQSIAIRSFEVVKPRDTSKPYVLYTIEIGTRPRSYKICRRYSDFERLCASIKLELGPALSRRCLPCLPPKSTTLVGYLTGSNNLINDPLKIAERQAGLERWLKTVLVHKELKHKTSQSPTLLKFFELDNLNSTSSRLTKTNPKDDISPNRFTSQSWLSEHNEIRTSVREIYDLISRRDELLKTQHSNSTSTTLAEVNRINHDAKRTLANVTERLGRLADSLKLFTQPSDPNGRTTLTEGEVSRRLQLISTLQDDCERLSKMSVVTRAEVGVGMRQTNQLLSSEATSRARAELLGPHNNRLITPPTTRILGVPESVASICPAEETPETRQRENRQMMDHQLHHIIDQSQEAKLKSLTQILLRQKQIGLMINQELAEQNEMLDDLDRNVDSASRKLTEARKKIDRLTS